MVEIKEQAVIIPCFHHIQVQPTVSVPPDQGPRLPYSDLLLLRHHQTAKLDRVYRASGKKWPCTSNFRPNLTSATGVGLLGGLLIKSPAAPIQSSTGACYVTHVNVKTLLSFPASMMSFPVF